MAKKIMALIMAMVMAVGLAACSGSGNAQSQNSSQAADSSSTGSGSSAAASTSSKPVTLTWWWPGVGGEPDMQLVNDAFNKLLHTQKGFENVSITFHEVNADEYDSALTLGISAEEPMDIFSTCAYIDFSKYIRNGSLMDITTLVNAHTSLKNEFPDWLWKYMSADGKIYAVPNYQRAASRNFYCTPKEYMDKYGDYNKLSAALTIDARPIDRIKAIADYVRAIRAGGHTNVYLQPITAFYTYNLCPIWSDTLGGGNGGFILENNSNTVSYIYTDDRYKELYAYAAQLYKEGLISQEELSGKTTYNDGTFGRTPNNDQTASCYAIYADLGIGTSEEFAATKKANKGYDFSVIPMSNTYYIGMSYAAGGQGISAKCANSDTAVSFLELMNTKTGKELYNMLVYGIEGVHYTKTGDDTIKTLGYNGSQAMSSDGARYGTWKWALGNTFYAYDNQGCAVGEKEKSLAINNNATNVISRLQGVILDKTSVQSKIDQVTAIEGEYLRTLTTGSLGDGWEAYYNEFETKVKAAGRDEILANLQKQVSPYLK